MNSVGKGGIGDALAQEFSRQGGGDDATLFFLSQFLTQRLIIAGYNVFGTLLPHEGRDHLASHGIKGFTADVTSDDDTKRLMQELEPLCGGKLDVLVNNA